MHGIGERRLHLGLQAGDLPGLLPQVVVDVFRGSSVEAASVVAPLHLVAEHFPPMGCPQQPAQQEIARENNFENKDKTKKGEKENY